MVFELPDDQVVKPQELQRKLSQGVGLYTETGLGQWAVMPTPLDTPKLAVHELTSSSPPKSPPQLPIIDWAKRVRENRHHKVEASTLAIQWVSSMRPYCGGQEGLTRAQLGSLRTSGMFHEGDALYAALFEPEGEYSLVSDRGVRALKWSYQRGRESAAEKLQSLFDGSKPKQHLWSLILQATASKLARELNLAQNSGD